MPTPEAKAKREHKLNRRVNTVMYVTLAMFISLLMLSPAVVNASRNSDSSKRTDEISACRSIFNSELNEARTAKSEATRIEDRAQNHYIRATDRVTEVALLRPDEPDLLDQALAELDSTRAALDDAETRANVAGAEERRQNDIYAALTKLSLDDPDRFLAECKARS